MTIVVDSSVVVAALTDGDAVGQWARAGLAAEALAAPAHVYVEVSSVLRRGVLTGRLSAEVGALALRDAVRLPLDVYGFEPFAGRVWELRPSVTAYDAAYVALAEELDAPLWTLDRRLARASGPRCAFDTGPS